MTLRKTFSPRGMVALFFAALTLIGLLLSGGYGLPVDEPEEQQILRENLKEYAIRLCGEYSDPVRYYDRLGVVRSAVSIERDHGESAYYPFAPLLAALENRPDLRMLLWHGYTWLLYMLGAFALYMLCRELGLSRAISCLAVFIYATCPRFFAEGHYNNKDMVLLSLMLAALWLGARFLRKPGFARGLCFSLLGALATNTKIVGALPWGLIGLCAVVLVTARREWSLRMLSVATATVASYALFYALMTPALLADPAGYLTYLIGNATGFTRWTGVVIFRGARYAPAVSGMPRSYLPYMMLVTLPLYVLPLCAVGQISALRGLRRKGALREPRAHVLLVLTICWLLPLAYAALAKPVLYNGWRHFYFVFAGLAPMLALGLGALWRFVKKRGAALRIAAIAMLCALLGLNVAGVIVNHPHQYAYYNVLARASAERDMELDYWDVSTLEAMKRLIGASERDGSLPLVLGARDDMSWFGVEHGYQVLHDAEKVALAVQYRADAPYLLFNTTYALIYGTAEPEGYHALLSVQSYGNTLCTVYERDGA